MNDLSEKLTKCVDLVQGESIYLDYPVHDNIGDHLIWAGSKALLRREQVKVIGQFGARLGPKVRHLIKQSKTICLHGGGNFGDLYPLHEGFRKEVIRRYTEKRIVIFPQSVHYENDENFKEIKELILAHPDIHICIRDQESFDFLQSHGVPNIYLFPDTAHALWPVKEVQKADHGSILNLLRKDIEASHLPADLEGAPLAVDWCDLNVGLMRQYFDLGTNIDRISGRLLGNYLPSYASWSFVSNQLISKAVKLFSEHETIVTNRLHGMILAALMQKKCIVYDNSYGKLSRYYNLWLKDVPNIEFRSK